MLTVTQSPGVGAVTVPTRGSLIAGQPVVTGGAKLARLVLAPPTAQIMSALAMALSWPWMAFASVEFAYSE